MASTINVDIVSAEGEVFSGPAKMVFLPASEGEIGVAPRHAPLLSLLKPLPNSGVVIFVSTVKVSTALVLGLPARSV